MTYDEKIVKQIIETFIVENSKNSIHVQNKDGEMILANKAIFDIESFLVTLRNQYDINNRLDTSIVSDNILTHFSRIDASSAYAPGDYQYNFLCHLAETYTPKADLYLLINGFIEKFKSQFILADIVITNTGATRCKTNIRFALNTLRDFGLVLSRDKNDKRSWSPSVLGLVTLLNMQFCQPETKKRYYRDPDVLIRPGTQKSIVFKVGPLDPLLWYSLIEFRQPDHLYIFLSSLSDNALTENEKIIIQQILDDFIEFTHEGLDITPDGIKITKKFKLLSGIFQQKIFDHQVSNPNLQEKLFAHFKKIDK